MSKSASNASNGWGENLTFPESSVIELATLAIDWENRGNTMGVSERSKRLVGCQVQPFCLYYQIQQEYLGTMVHGRNERVQRAIGVQPNSTFLTVLLNTVYSRDMLVLWGMAGMSERNKRLVGGQIQPFFNYNPAKGG